MSVLQPFEVPLDGINLIEASAGTGKTYSITSLYLRLLLEKELSVDRILVVTFTKAATEELRDRIRKRIRQALAMLQGDAQARKDDEELAAWLQGREESAGDARRLRMALASMDSAAVFTIHGFCQRVLTDNAFETGMSFQPQFLENEDELRLRAAEDFWRSWFDRMKARPELAQQVLEAFPQGPTDLARQLAPRLFSDDLRVLPEGSGKDGADLDALHAALVKSWRRHKGDIRKLLETTPELNRRSYTSKIVAQALAAAEEVAAAPGPVLDPPRHFERLSPWMLARGSKSEQTPPAHPFFDLVGDYLGFRAGFLADFQRKARDFLRRHMAEHKEREGLLSFDDQLKKLDAALAGAGGQVLAQGLRQQYPMAMIDEFQDTDEVQYRVFKAIYGKQAPGTGLCLIGDPKQAIYGFRGGDIFTYLEAARDAARRYSLDTNWRSSAALVTAINHLFQSRKQPFLHEDIHYRPVQAAPRADEEPLLVDGKPLVPLQFWKLPAGEKGKALAAETARQLAAGACARHMAYLLQPGRAVLGERALKAGDIAILVRSRSSVPLLQEALAAEGIHSVSLSDDSVFGTAEAQALRDLLQAIVECEDEGLLRYVLAGPLMGRDARDIQRLNQDEGAWEKLQQAFFTCRQRWREQGFVQAFQPFFREQGMAARLLSSANGERRLTNLLQLVELLQQASRSHPGLEALLRWLTTEMDQAGGGEEARLRLESDADLVKIVTMHAAKGLEYPVVYIPFPWLDEGARSKAKPWFFHDEDQQACLYFGGADPVLEERAEKAREREHLAEKLRLLYVSLTRAGRLCVLPWGKVNQAEKSALAWLLFPGEDASSAMKDLPAEAIFRRLQALAEQAPQAMEVRELPEEDARLPGKGQENVTLQARPFRAFIQRDWRVNSYSALVRGQNLDGPDHDFQVMAPPVECSLHDDPLQVLPAGPGFGLLVHELLELLDFRQADEKGVQALVCKLSYKYGLPELRQEAGSQAMGLMIRRVLETQLPRAGLTLQMLPRQARVDEMAFHFSTGRLTPQRLAALLQDYPAWRHAAEGVDFPAFQGLMQGFIDLVFRHQGRYWLADYKSNRLEDYGPAGVEAAMQIHHYPLQALIYSLALHRHLAQRLKDYDPQQHLGGVFYLFTRGMKPGGTSGIWYQDMDVELLEALDRMLLGRE